MLDNHFKEPLYSVRVDTMGRIFVGGRESLSVYEPHERDVYRAPRLLCEFPRESWLHDIEIRGDDLYVLTKTALYWIKDGVRKREDLKPVKLIWGIPRGEAWRGFAGLAWGPEGDLYFTAGKPDKTPGHEFWTFFCQPEGTKLPYRGNGGVFRCKPDGSNLRVVAQGLPSAGALAFDSHWNLFTTGNQDDKPMRLWQVTPHARLGKPIGRADGLAPIFARDDGLTQGARLGFSDDAGLPDAWREKLLVTRGSALFSFALKPAGARFTAKTGPNLDIGQGGAIAIGRGGRLFACNDSLVLLTRKGEDIKKLAFDSYEASEAKPKKLWQELADPSWQRRYRAHIEITRRGGDLLKEANKRLLDAKADDPALHHLIWLAAQSGQGSVHLLGLTAHADPKVRVQVIRALTEFPEQLRGEPIFTKLLDDHDAQVRHAALLAYFAPKIVFDRAVQRAVERGPAREADPLIRQTAALLLAEKATLQQIEGLCDSVDETKRLAGVLAAGYRLTVSPTHAPLPQHLPLKKHADDSYAIVEYADGKVDLRDRGRIGTFTIAAHWKADKHTVEQELLFKLMRRMVDDANETVGLQATAFLLLLDDARVLK